MIKTRNTRAPLAALSVIALALALSACGQKEEAPTSSAPAVEAPATTPAPASGAADPAASNQATPTAPGATDSQSSLSQAADATQNAADTAAVALDDTGITTQVKAELVKDSELSALDVSVETNGGQVTLTGHAPTAQAKERAEGLAKGVEGVKGVTNNLEVKAH
ncbi:MAG: BON domain-containing protein [Comamonas sp.]